MHRTTIVSLIVAALVAMSSRPLAAPRPATPSFTAVGSMSVTRFFHTATLLGTGQVLIAGGATSTGVTDTAELFDPTTGTFAVLPNKMTTARFQHTATMLS